MLNHKNEELTENEFLLFDNYPFKLAIIQLLMYDLELLGSKYLGGDEYFETYKDFAEVSEEESINRLKLCIERGNRFFMDLNIPCSLADKVQNLLVESSQDVYYQINPQSMDFDEYFENGKAFDIIDISEKEMKQFPNLQSITFNMYHTPPEKLLKKLESFGIIMNPQD